MKRIKRIIAVPAVIIAACFMAILFAGCVIPWYIPVNYGKKKTEKIYGIINSLLENRSAYYADFAYFKEGSTEEITCVNVCRENDDYCIVWYDYEKDGFCAYYADGQYTYYDKVTEEQTVRSCDISEFSEIFGEIDGASEYMKTIVRDWYDGYCCKCFPWGFGWAMVYYHTDYTLFGEYCDSASASWDIRGSVKAVTNLSLRLGSLNVTFNGETSDGPIHKMTRMKPIMRDTFESAKYLGLY